MISEMAMQKKFILEDSTYDNPKMNKQEKYTDIISTSPVKIQGQCTCY